MLCFTFRLQPSVVAFHDSIYRMCIIITYCLYILKPLFEGQKTFFRICTHNILALCMVTIQDRFIIKSWIWIGLHTVNICSAASSSLHTWCHWGCELVSPLHTTTFKRGLPTQGHSISWSLGKSKHGFQSRVNFFSVPITQIWRKTHALYKICSVWDIIQEVKGTQNILQQKTLFYKIRTDGLWGLPV